MSNLRRFGSWCLDRGVILAACLVATAAALIASYSGLSGVAGLAGWADSVRPMLPLTVDVVAVAVGILVQRTRDAEIRRVAWRGVKWSAAVSIIGNAVDHLWTITHSGDVHSVWAWVRVALAVLISAVPASFIAFMIHVLALMTPTAAEAPAEVGPQPEHKAPAPAPAPAAAPVRASVFTLPNARATKWDQGLRMIDAAKSSGVTLTSDDLAVALNCTPRYAQKLLAAV